MINNTPYIVSKDNQYNDAMNFFKQYSRIEKDTLVCILNILDKDSENHKEKLTIQENCGYIQKLIRLEKCFQQSEGDYKVQIVADLFFKSIETKKTNGLDLNALFGMTPVAANCLGYAVNNEAPGLIEALIKNGADVNNGGEFTDNHIVVSPFYFLNRKSSQYPELRAIFRETIIDECVKSLLKFNCSFRGDPCLRLPLSSELICNKQDLRSIKLIASAKADFSNDRFALYYATHQTATQFEMAKVLIDSCPNLFYISEHYGGLPLITKGNPYRYVNYLINEMDVYLDKTKEVLISLGYPRVLSEMIKAYLSL